MAQTMDRQVYGGTSDVLGVGPTTCAVPGRAFVRWISTGGIHHFQTTHVKAPFATRLCTRYVGRGFRSHLCCGHAKCDDGTSTESTSSRATARGVGHTCFSPAVLGPLAGDPWSPRKLFLPNGHSTTPWLTSDRRMVQARHRATTDDDRASACQTLREREAAGRLSARSTSYAHIIIIIMMM
eukprot:scaffold111_cov404-Prasinococcus_capsulatus_cf.AAC.6